MSKRAALQAAGLDAQIMWVRDLEWIDPVEAAARLAGLGSLSFLDSAMSQPRLGRYSYVAMDPFGHFVVRGDRAFWNGRPLSSPPILALKQRLAELRTAPVDGLPPFQGGAIGLFGYEFGWALEGRHAPRPAGADDVHLAFHDLVVAFDHEARAAWIIASGLPAGDEPSRRRRAEERLDLAAAALGRPSVTRATAPKLVWRAETSQAAYCAGVECVKAYIRAGDIYQANIAQRLVADMPGVGDPWALYLAARTANPAPFCAYLECGPRTILSTSPELFLRSDGRHVETRPIKGTARRVADEVADHAVATRLLTSRKDRAENVMIVDLLRNDLARVCEPASVDVPVLCVLETYAGLHHLVSSVTGTLAPGRDAIDLVAATFPGGSITGAPKIRAMEIIAEIEGRPRGAYCGAIGAIGFDGMLDLNIAIRTVVAEGRRLELCVGGGITILSDPREEYRETWTKAQKIVAALGELHVEAAMADA